jgi:hypothetical protein
MDSTVSLSILVADKVKRAREISRVISQTARRKDEGSCRQINSPANLLDTAVVYRGQDFLSENATFLEHTVAQDLLSSKM